jgi:hypothetical protein
MHIAAVVALVLLAIFAIIGMFVGSYFAAAISQVIFNKHAELLRRRVLTKEYPVEDLDGMDISTLPPTQVSVDAEDMSLLQPGANRM